MNDRITAPAPEYAVRVNGARFGGMTEADARHRAALCGASCFDAVLERWDGAAFVEVERFPPASRLVAVLARPHTVVRGRH